MRLFFAAIVLLIYPSLCEIVVSSAFSEIILTKTVNLPSGYYGSYMLPITNSEDDYFVWATGGDISETRISVTPCFKDSVDTSRTIKGELNHNNPVFFKALRPSEQDDSVLILYFNPGKFESKFELIVNRLGERDTTSTNYIQNHIYTIVNPFASFYKFDAIIKVRPCFESNAFYKDTIVVCTELLADLIKNDNFEAMNFILYHEIGHYIMKEYGLPGFDNEDLADEFALVYCGQHSKTSLEKVLKFISVSNESIYNQMILKAYGLNNHPLSTERVFRILKKYDKIEEYDKRWKKLLRPYFGVKLLQNKNGN